MASLASTIAKTTSATADEAARAAKAVDESKIAQEGVGRAAEEVGKTPQVAVRQPARGVKILGGATLGTAAVWKGGDFLEAREEAKQAASQEEALQRIWEDPHLSNDEKKQLVERLANQGFFDSPGGDEGGPGIFQRIFGGVGIQSFILALVVIWGGSKVLANAVN